MSARQACAANDLPSTSPTAAQRAAEPARRRGGPECLPRHGRADNLEPLAVRRAEGFTLIELMVVISLIVILASMGLVQYRQSIVRASEATLKEDLFRMRDAIDQYYADKNQYPATLEALVSDGYLRQVPIDPFTKSGSTWQSVPAEPDPNNPASEPGIFDVKSGSESNALDGTRYAEW